MKVVERDVDFVGAAVMGGHCRLSPGTECNIIVMSFFEEKARHEICRQDKKSDTLSSHLCPLSGEVSEYTKTTSWKETFRGVELLGFAEAQRKTNTENSEDSMGHRGKL